MTDGYSAWRTLDGVRQLGCFAHARRYFDEAAKAQGKADGRTSRWTMVSDCPRSTAR